MTRTIKHGCIHIPLAPVIASGNSAHRSQDESVACYDPKTQWETKPVARWLLSCCLRPDSNMLSSAQERRNGQAAVLEGEQRHCLLTRCLVPSCHPPAFWSLFSFLFRALRRKETLSELCHRTNCQREPIVILEIPTVFTSKVGTLVPVET